MNAFGSVKVAQGERSMDYSIYIPTLGRFDRQKSFEQLPDRVKPHVWFVVHRNEEPQWRTRTSNLVVMDVIGAPAFRQAAVEHCTTAKMLMFDDDLEFGARSDKWTVDFPQILKSTPAQIEAALAEMAAKLDEYAMVGMGARQMNQALKGDYNKNSRIMRAFGVRVDLLKDLNIRFDKFKYWEDFHVVLSFLRRGYSTLSLNRYTNNASTNSDGGCSVYRNPKDLKEVREAFLTEHGRFCVAVDKPATGWRNWDDTIAPDLRVAWKRAYEERDLCMPM
jgi:hypothetical protein